MGSGVGATPVLTIQKKGVQGTRRRQYFGRVVCIRMTGIKAGTGDVKSKREWVVRLQRSSPFTALFSTPTPYIVAPLSRGVSLMTDNATPHAQIQRFRCPLAPSWQSTGAIGLSKMFHE